jgi:hypothetical protein
VVAEQAFGDVVGRLAGSALRPSEEPGRWCYMLGHTSFTPEAPRS